MTRLLVAFVALLAGAGAAEAHVLDQYLQIAQVELQPEGARIALRLVPGAQLADAIVAAIDADGDGALSAAERQAHAQRVSHDLALELDGESVPLVLTAYDDPPPSQLKQGIGAIRLELETKAALAVGDHRLSFHNNHHPDRGAYLANALVPASPQIEITRQVRDVQQRTLEIHFHVRSEARPVRLLWLSALSIGLGAVALSPRWRRRRLSDRPGA